MVLPENDDDDAAADDDDDDDDGADDVDGVGNGDDVINTCGRRDERMSISNLSEPLISFYALLINAIVKEWKRLPAELSDSDFDFDSEKVEAHRDTHWRFEIPNYSNDFGKGRFRGRIEIGKKCRNYISFITYY